MNDTLTFRFDKSVSINKMTISNSFIKPYSSIIADTDTLILNNCVFGKGCYFFLYNFRKNRPCNLVLINTDINDLDVNPYSYNLISEPNLYKTYELLIIQKAYGQLLAKYEKEKATIYYEHLMHKYLRFKTQNSLNIYGVPLGNFIDVFLEGWYEYGYNKPKGVIISLIIFLIFIISNAVLFPVLNRSIYALKFTQYRFAPFRSGRRRGQINYRISHILSVVLYTGVIFWGLKFDVDRIQAPPRGIALRHYAFVFYLYAQYIIGLFCLVYIAGVILIR